jgi:hypothetical protein
MLEKTHFKSNSSLILKSLVIFLAVWFVGILSYSFMEASVVNSASDTSTTTATLTVQEEITLTSPTNLNMDPINLSVNTSTTGTEQLGSGNGFNVETNSQNGYKLELKATGTPAMQATSTGEAFDDASSTLQSWSNQVGPNDYKFGFSVLGNDVSTSTWGDSSGNGCKTSATDPNGSLNYRGFNGTTNIEVASSTDETASGGIDTHLCIVAEQGSNTTTPSGNYKAVIVGTATTL